MRHILSLAILAGLSFPALAAPSVTAKQISSADRLCQVELHRRLGGAQSTVSISTDQSISSATTIRLTGQGTFDRGDGSRLQPFNFSCIVNLTQNRVSSLSYTLTQRLNRSQFDRPYNQL